MTKSTLELKRLIYGQSNVIVLTHFDNYFEAIKEIELVRSSMSIEGFIFKSDFADTKKLKSFTAKDWAAMFAQYALTYGWSKKYKALTGEEASTVLQDYVNEEPDAYLKKAEVTISEHNFTVEPIAHYKTVLEDIAKSKTVLREQQIRIIGLMPTAIVEEVFKETKFTIKETEILFIKRLIQSGSKAFKFTEPDQILRFLVASFRKNGEGITGQINKTILKSVELKIPTSIKKKIWKDLDNMHYVKVAASMKKFNQFWKRIYKQISFESEAKTKARFSRAFSFKEKLYDNDFPTDNSVIEKFKSQGNYKKALEHEMKNPGQMLRNLMQYLRYEEGELVVRKSKPRSNQRMADMLGGNNAGIVIRKDAKSTLKSDEFYDALLKANPKLLWQVYGLVDKESNMLKPTNVKKMNNVRITYESQIVVKHQLASIVRKKIKNAIKQIKREENIALGGVYLDPEIANYVIQYSGREDTSLSMSGEYLPSGARINLDELIPDKDLDKLILRIGLAWKGRSIDIDLSMNVKGYGPVYYGKNEMYVNNDLIMASSGDITSCANDIFSTELVDVDLKKFKENGFNEMFNSAIVYSGRTFKDTECYWFMSVLKKKDRVSPGRQVKINLDEMHYATQITDDSKGIMGLYFNIEKGYAEVLNIPMPHAQNGMNASIAEQRMLDALKEMPVRQNFEDAISMAVNKQQRVDEIQFADLIISNTEPDAELLKEDAVWLHPGRDAIKIQEILF